MLTPSWAKTWRSIGYNGRVLGTLDIGGLLELLHAGETVILPSLRAARSIREAFDTAQRTLGRRAWELPPLHDWRAWMDSLWSRLILEGVDDRMLLNHLQEQTLWAEIISTSASDAPLTGGAVRDLSQLAASAFALCAAHSVGEQVFRTADSHDSRAYAEWHEEFTTRCHEEGLLSRSLIEVAIAEHLRAADMRLPHTLHFAGFEQQSPSCVRLLVEAERSGVMVVKHRLVRSGRIAEPTHLVGCPDPWDEARWAIRWAGAYLRSEDEVPRSVALVVPDPGAERPDFEPLLRELLAPELEAVGADLSSTPWQFSAGTPLAETPPVHAALSLLQWIEQELPLERVSGLLLSPFFTHRSTPEERVRFETHVLRRGRRLRPELGLSAVLELARGVSARVASSLELDGFEAVQKLVGDAQAPRGPGSHADWAELVRRLLRAAGWPGERPLSAMEFRATEAWDGLLDLVSTLDFSRRRLSFREFLNVLQQGAGEQKTGSSPSSAPVSILRLAEAEACSFDATVILRATDGHLPPAERLHPLLGKGLQRLLQLPGADTSLTYRNTRERLERLRERSGRMLLTWSEANDNGALRPSPLAFDLRAERTSADLLLPSAGQERSVELELVDKPAPPPPLAGRSVPGGARVLELQAACGFRAFASLRLQAGTPEPHSLGMDARDRGSVLHRALELFWSEVKTQAALRRMTGEERRHTLQRCVAKAFERQRASVTSDDDWSLSFLSLSEERLVRLLETWLGFELQRGDFTVLPPEQERSVEIGPLELTVRPDRVDRVEGGFVFVDYKTSLDLHTRHWLGERPDAPQLPLYTLLGEAEEVRGLAFAQLRPGQKMGWIGLQKDQGDIHTDPKTRVHDLELQTKAWREELSRLAHAFAEGVTDVDPKSYPHTCRFCEQRLLCRIDRSAWLAQDEDADAAADGEQDG